MNMMHGDLVRYHDERVQELAGQYQNAKWQEKRLLVRVKAFTQRAGSWFGMGAESVAGTNGRLEPQPVRIENR